MTQLQGTVADLTQKLDSQSKRKSNQDVSVIESELRSERNASRNADERLKLMQYQLDQLKESNQKQAAERDGQASLIK